MWNDKPDEYPIPTRNLMGMGMNFYPQPLCWRVGNCFTRPEPDLLPSLFSALISGLRRWVAPLMGMLSKLGPPRELTAVVLTRLAGTGAPCKAQRFLKPWDR
jgi:hypothetical protein